MMKRIDWEILADELFIVVLTSPFWVPIGTAIYVMLAAVFGFPL